MKNWERKHVATLRRRLAHLEGKLTEIHANGTNWRGESWMRSEVFALRWALEELTTGEPCEEAPSQVPTTDWITATVVKGEGWRRARVTEPWPYPGLDADRLEATIDPQARRCKAVDGEYRCPLVEDHVGPHWRGERHLVDELGGPVRLWLTIFELEP